MANTYGYIRVSSQDQNEERQLIAMQKKLVPKNNHFIDKQSGQDFDRPQYSKADDTPRRADSVEKSNPKGGYIGYSN